MCQHQFLRTHTKAYSKPELFQLTALVLNYCVELTPVLDFANSMAPHLTKKELDIMRDLKVDKKWTPLEIHAKITSQREKKNIATTTTTTATATSNKQQATSNPPTPNKEQPTTSNQQR